MCRSGGTLYWWSNVPSAIVLDGVISMVAASGRTKVSGTKEYYIPSHKERSHYSNAAKELEWSR